MYQISWENASIYHGVFYQCPHCGRNVGPSMGFKGEYLSHDGKSYKEQSAYIHICPVCTYPTMILSTGEMIPSPACGDPIKHLPCNVSAIYTEARRSTTCGAYTGAVQLCRTLLMHVAVEKGADDNLTYAGYVNYLQEHNHVPPGCEQWIDRIREMGNDVAHDLMIVERADAALILKFSGMLLKLTYEFPGEFRTPSAEEDG